MSRLSLVLVTLVLACGGGGEARPDPVEPRPKSSVHPAVARMRKAHDDFHRSAAAASDFDTLTAAIDKVRPALAAAARAEADVVVMVAAGRMLADGLESAPDDEGGVLAATVFPIAFGLRMLDGESVPAYRDRVCVEVAKTACEGALPEFWGRALSYAAAAKVGSLAAGPAEACACASIYAVHLERLAQLGEHAASRDQVERRYWGLDGDPLPRSAFANPDSPTGVVAAQLGTDGALQLGGEPIAGDVPAKELMARLETARGRTPAADAVLEVVAPAQAQASVFASLFTAAQALGWRGVALTVRQAAPPHYRGRLSLGLVHGKAPAGVTGLWPKKRETVQALVDRIDAALGLGEGARAALVAPR